MSSGRVACLCLYMTRSPGILLCDAEGLRPDVVTLDALARLRLAAARLGMELQLSHCSPELRAVIAFAGLEAVLPVDERAAR